MSEAMLKVDKLVKRFAALSVTDEASFEVRAG